MTPVLCFGGNTGTATATASGGTPAYSYNWSPSGGSNATATGLSANTYTVTVTDAQWCTAQTSSLVNEPTQLIASISSQDIGCSSSALGSASVTAAWGTAPYSYLWSNGSPTQTASGLSAGTYSVIVTDAKWCITTNAVVITATSNLLNVNITSTVACGSSNTGTIDATVSGWQYPYTFNWSNGATTQNINGLSAGTYSLTITDGNLCQWIGSQLIQSSPISVSLNDTMVCVNNTTLITWSVTGTSPFQYSWTMPNGQMGTSQYINPIDSGKYVLTVTDAFGCSASDSMNVTLKSCNNGIDDPSNTSNIQMYPNPVKSGSTIVLEDIPVWGVGLHITNVLGQVVYDTHSQQEKIQFSANWGAGLYTLKITQGNKVIYKKIIVE